MIAKVIDRENPTVRQLQQSWIVVMSVVFRVKDLNRTSPCLPIIKAEVELIAGTRPTKRDIEMGIRKCLTFSSPLRSPIFNSLPNAISPGVLFG